MSDTCYYKEYPGYWPMLWHDGNDDLRRWFENYRIDKSVLPPFSTEWMTIEEYAWTCRGKKITRYEGRIGADHHDNIRPVRFETGAPPPPTFMQPVRQKHVVWTEPPGWAERRARAYAQAEREFWASMRYAITPQQRFVANVLPPIERPKTIYIRNT